MEAACELIFELAKRLGHKLLKEMIQLYRRECFSGRVYGAGVWGYVVPRKTQVAENKFLFRLLDIHQATASFISHMEMGMGFLEDYMGMAPLLLWVARKASSRGR